jgi:hypothetical protein
VSGLARRREQLVRQVVSESAGFAGYAELEVGQAADFAETVGEGLDAILVAMAEHRSFDEDDVAFLWSHIRRRTEAGVSEGDMLAVVRVFQRALWDAIIELAGEGEDGRGAALILARPLLDYVEVLSGVVHEAFAEAEAAISSTGGALRTALLEMLLSGAELIPGSQLSLARRSGLDLRSDLVVIVARPVQATVDEAALRVAAPALARAMGDPTEPLAGVRGDEIVVVRSTVESQAAALAAALEAACARLADRKLPLAVGLSTVHPGLAAVPAGYREACLAVEQLRESGGVLALGGLGVADYLILRAGDGTAWRLVPRQVRNFVAEDARQGGVLSDTLLAFLASDLSVKLAAERLFVHPNTAHYRLSKIEERTGRSIRRLGDVLLLAIAVRLQRERDG